MDGAGTEDAFRRMSRRALLGTAMLVLAACERESPTEQTSFDEVAMSAESAAAAARDLLTDVRRALEDALGPLSWEEADPEQVQTSGSSCSYVSATWRCDTYLGHERGTPEQIADAVGSVLRDHGWPECPVPGGGAGGWLTTESVHDALTFRFRSKGMAEISVDGAVTGSCQLPPEAKEPSEDG